MSALRSEATCRLGKTPPRTGALQIALFGGLETPKVFASGRPLLAHVDSSTAREVDRPLRRAMLNKSRLSRHYFSIEPRTLSGLESTFTRDANRELHLSGAKKVKKIQKTVLHLFSGLDTSAQTQAISGAKTGATKV